MIFTAFPPQKLDPIFDLVEPRWIWTRMTGECVFPGIMIRNTPAHMLNAGLLFNIPLLLSGNHKHTRASCHLTIAQFRARVGSTVIVRKLCNRGDKTPLREEASTSGGFAVSPVCVSIGWNFQPLPHRCAWLPLWVSAHNGLVLLHPLLPFHRWDHSGPHVTCRWH